MRIAVLIKQVPDSWAQKSLDADFRLDRANVDNVLNDLDEYAVEAALTLREQHGGDVVAICMGPATAADAIRRALSMGCDSAVHVMDDELRGADLWLTSKVLAAAVERGGYDLVISGVESTDARGGVMAAMLAERLSWPQLSYLSALEIQSDRLIATRTTERRQIAATSALPAVVSVVEKFNTPRYPNLKGIMAAKTKPVEQLAVADLGLAGLTPKVRVTRAEPMPARGRGRVVQASDPGAVNALVEFLVERKAI